ncbi:hypothetical protein HYALB_00002733 [Hymenoscyphus albidus]|uniref:Phosphoglycerate mutase-like protein n=1 Tax=Hymenoscyphus albidus TaxID=595503 RepID=A0A9N9Q7Y4_9HELO|nr:hypothetical protein HYALB_00002733 [Hymenoscyphus albidus]
MGWPPAVVIVVRHGARLDAADKQWHLTSPTPYDPPLTYGGWTQSRSLGQRIANILRTRETDDEVLLLDDAEGEGGKRRKRRHKVIIHTSPFQRCVQTATAISAGLAQNPGHTNQRPFSSHSGRGSSSPMHSSPRIRPTIATGSPSLTPILEPANIHGKAREIPENIKKSIIRVDAFLGEWLTPEYFELITPPPSSPMMVAGAKADLLRREDYKNLISSRDFAGGTAHSGHQKPFPGGWGSPTVSAEEDRDESPLGNMSALGQALRNRDRTSSLSSVGTNGSHKRGRSKSPLPAPNTSDHGIYQPPIPSYAISLSDPIPAGYVSHARDACVDVDYQWDSMREPQLWGSGGEYGEEWSSMHKRFRKGIQHMIDWYQSDDDPGKLLTKVPPSPAVVNIPGVVDENQEDEDTDLVLILVTHGAGCNALIGALTNQPVLLDVGMASLTMAVRKPSPKSSPSTTPAPTSSSHSRNPSKNILISEEYEVKLVANTEHLRSVSTASTPTPSRNPSIIGGSFRERFGSYSGSFEANKSVRPITSGSLGSMRRTASVASSAPRSYVPARQSSIGLWSAAPPEDDPTDEPGDDMILNFGDDGAADSKAKEETKPGSVFSEEDEDKEETGEKDDVAPLPATGGLWGSPIPSSFPERMREVAPKRRWTVNERS